ncbi:universal stress protein [Couchioplanes caeruleus]|uniref:universal stress protein n=1 Tax=Couchioplanes caeruleus TaxID=56438 RepID=UPI0020C06531|nr:universal stress protein [Couchioplanes caeruleus]UQU62325.1 universal stress protein [Couchioplanes caeruleus]
MTAPGIVVGANGSATSTAAVRWAAAEAQLRGVGLDVVVAYQWRIPGRSFASRGELVRTTGAHVREILDAAVNEARSSAEGVPVRGAAIVGDPVPVLLEAATDADLLVVGGRGRGSPGPLLSPVTTQLAAYAPSSVAVVRPGWSSDRRTVVVGVTESPGASTTMGTAFEEANLRRPATLLAVTAQTGPDRVLDQLAPWRGKYPEVPVVCHVASGEPGAVLVEKSREAGLLVVGAGSHQDFEGLRLGPIRLHLLHHAECPVLIARDRR